MAPFARLGLNAQHYRIVFRARQPVLLPPFKGSTFRGAFVETYKRLVCTQNMAPCEGCLLRSSCPYPLVVEPLPPVPGSPWARVANPPRGYVLRPPLTPRGCYAPGELFSLGLILFGQAVRFLPFFIIALRQVGIGGLGAERSHHYGRADLVRVTRIALDGEWDEGDSASLQRPADDESVVYSEGDTTVRPPLPDAVGDVAARVAADLADRGGVRRIGVRTMTPLRLKVGGELLRDHLPFDALVRSALTRVSALSAVHGEGPLDLDFRATLTASTRLHCVSADSEWWAAERYSSRQERRVPINGLVGNFVYEGDVAPFLPILAAAQITHMGNGTTFGLGMVRCTPG